MADRGPQRATRFAATLGRVFGYLFIAGGLLLVAGGISFEGIWLALIGMMINGAARGATMQTAISSRIGEDAGGDVMDREPVAIPGELSVEQALDQYFLRYRWPWFPVVDAAYRFLGLLERDRADRFPRSRAPPRWSPSSWSETGGAARQRGCPARLCSWQTRTCAASAR